MEDEDLIDFMNNSLKDNEDESLNTFVKGIFSYENKELSTFAKGIIDFNKEEEDE